MKCKSCKKAINPNAVQMGGYHIGCAEEAVEVFKIRPEPGMNWLIGEGYGWVKHSLAEMRPGDSLEIECENMQRIMVDNLPEHGGW